MVAQEGNEGAVVGLELPDHGVYGCGACDGTRKERFHRPVIHQQLDAR